MGSLVGIDFGKKRTGLACTDPLKMIASGLNNLPTSEVIPFLKNYCKTEDVETFIVGKPLQKDGAPGTVELHIKDFIEKLKRGRSSQPIPSNLWSFAFILCYLHIFIFIRGSNC